MRASAFFAVLPIVVLASANASAHFMLQHPPDALKTDDIGDPEGADGTQKMNPCGAGTTSGMVTKVHAGAMLHVKLTETVAHGGHYRIALVPKYDLVDSDVPEPAVTLKAGQCDTAAVQSPVVPPVLADNLFVHTQAEATSGKLWETDVQLPTTTGDATLQIIEFMTPHSPQCFYHHCAKLEIVPASTDLGPTGELVVGPDGGTSPGPGSDGGSSGSSGSSGTSGSSGSAKPSSSSGSGGDDGGCTVSGGGMPSFVVGFLGLGLVGSMLRRRRTARKSP